MSIFTLVLYIAILAAGLTLVMRLINRPKSWLMTFLQHFTGVLFLVSGFVKAVDPIGTAFKMEQYFTEFEYTFAETSASFLAPLFPFLGSISLLFSILMIVFEMVLGLMLIFGHRTKLTSWLFLLLVLFFTILTGFTYLTGYVPSGVNFFSFGSWEPYTATNMRVTDCGCFGDFIKLEPRISFFKDVVLLLPAFYFVFRHKDMHQLFTPGLRKILLGALTIIFTLFCLWNSLWNLPVVDFRPFKVGTDLYQKKTAEEDAAASVQVTGWKLQNNTSGEIVEVANEVYLAELKKGEASQYHKSNWSVVDQIKSKPAVEATKVSDFSITSPDGFDVSEDILTDTGHVFLIVAYKLKGESHIEQQMVADTIWAVDTVKLEDASASVVKSVDTILSQSITVEVFDWDQRYLGKYLKKINPLMKDVMEQGARVYAAAGSAGGEKLESFAKAAESEFAWHEADEILLKTIIRSNPGVVHLKGGKVLEMWHIRHLPASLQLK